MGNLGEILEEGFENGESEGVWGHESRIQFYDILIGRRKDG